MNVIDEISRGIGKAERRSMVRRWKREGGGLSLKAWARRQHPVGDAAQCWLEAKRRRAKQRDAAHDREAGS